MTSKPSGVWLLFGEIPPRCVGVVRPFSLLGSTLPYVCSTMPLSIPLLMDIWVCLLMKILLL